MAGLVTNPKVEVVVIERLPNGQLLWLDGVNPPHAGTYNEEGLHTDLVYLGYKRTEPFGDDPIAGRYVRKADA